VACGSRDKPLACPTAYQDVSTTSNQGERIVQLVLRTNF